MDGVLNPYAVSACPPGYTEHDFFPGEAPIRLCLAAPGAGYPFRTGWGAGANRILDPRKDLPARSSIRPCAGRLGCGVMRILADKGIEAE